MTRGFITPGNKKPGGAKKKPAAPPDPETSYIVFGDSKKESKKSNPDNPLDEPPKKPDVKSLVSGSTSWTGKLPVNLFQEFVQKQKWEKPNYQPRRQAQGGHYFVTVLTAVHPKTKQSVTLPPFELPHSHRHLGNQPTPVEARNFAACYALFRVSSNKNITLALPPKYRDYWKTFQELKAQDVADGKAWMYEADPFAAHEERQAVQALMEKQREAKAKAKAAAENDATPGRSGPTGSRAKPWSNVAKVELGPATRATIEKLVRGYTTWNPSESRPAGADLIVERLESMGFRPAHAFEAVWICKNQEEALEWLLCHVPEDDLPHWCFPEGYAVGISLASGNMKRDAMLKRLTDTGYSSELCEEALVKHGDDEARAAEALQDGLSQTVISSEAEDWMESLSLEDSAQTWNDEMETLKAIYDDRLKTSNARFCEIAITVPGGHPATTLRVMKSKAYPSTPPIIGIVKSAVPAYIRLSIYRAAILHLKETLLGEPMIFNLVDWLENESQNIMDNPGSLLELASAVTGSNELDSEHKTVQQKQSALRSMPMPINWNSKNEQSQRLKASWSARQSTPEENKMLQGRQSLPAWSLRDVIVAEVSSHQVTMICGETGSGKSTQAVQFILDDMIAQGHGAHANIVCTQPRRISALGLADRVSEERCLRVGEEVGYAIRGESKRTQGVTKITFMTIGVLLRRLQTSGGSRKDIVASLADISHVVVDEVHERSLDTDVLLNLLRDVLESRKDLKVILMSATVNAQVFQEYFERSPQIGKVGMVSISGRTFPIEDYYLDDILRMTNFGSTAGQIEPSDENMASSIQRIGMSINYDLIAATAKEIDADLGSVEGGILIFLPGVAEINRAIDAIRRAIPSAHVLPLHASLTPAEQRQVFPRAPRGKRKIIAATNVAETSITIEDIVAVIDTGRVKETSFDPQNNMVKLMETWASKAACKQRRGRAGRVQAGKCYKLYTRNAETKMPDRPEPEIRRVPLEQLCLSIRAMGVSDVATFLKRTLTPPDSVATTTAMDSLRRMGILNGDDLTALGQHLAMIPADLKLAKLMVYGALFGCLESMVTIAATLTVRSPFLAPQAKREEAKAARATFASGNGDLLTDLAAYEQWHEMRHTSRTSDLRRWCDENFISNQTMMDISTNRKQYLSSLREVGFLPFGYDASSKDFTHLNVHGFQPSLLRALIAGSFSPQLARIAFPDQKYVPSISGAVALDPEARAIKFFSQDAGRVFVHPSSTLFDAQSFSGNSVFLSYFTRMATSKIFVRDLTPFNAFSLLLFCGTIHVDTLGRGIIVDDWIRLQGWARIGVLVSRLRGLLDDALAQKMEDPGLSLSGLPVVDVVRRLIEFDGMDR